MKAVAISLNTMIRESECHFHRHGRHHAIQPSQKKCRYAFLSSQIPAQMTSTETKTIYASKAAGNRRTLSAKLPLLLKNWTYAPSTKTLPPAFFSMYSSRRRGVKPQFLETIIFWRPGNLYCERRRASRAVARSCLHVRNKFCRMDCC